MEDHAYLHEGATKAKRGGFQGGRTVLGPGRTVEGCVALFPGRRWLLSPLPPILGLFSWGCVLCLRYGRVGFMPLDQSIVFDGAWRLLSGQVPFRDFITPDSLTPMVLQVLFFKVLGVTWFAYCLHAAVLNGLFCCLVYGLLRGLGSSRATALLYGALSGVVFYTPFGVPYRDQHAFFFVLLAILMAVLAINRSGDRRSDLLWMFVPFAVGLGFFSKQSPTVLVVPVLLLYLSVQSRDRCIRGLRWIGTGTVLVAAILVLMAWEIPVDREWFRMYFFELPGAVGFQRLETLADPENLLPRLLVSGGLSRWSDPGIDVLIVFPLFVLAWYAFLSRRFLEARTLRNMLLAATTAGLLAAAVGGLIGSVVWGIFWPSKGILFGLTAITGCGILVALGSGGNIRQIRRSLDRCLPALVLAVGMTLTCLAFAVTTWHAGENSRALVFAGLGIAQICLMRLAVTVHGWIGDRGTIQHCLRVCLKALPWALAGLALFQAVNFHRYVNMPRTVHGLNRESSRDLSGSVVSPALAFMHWDVPSFVKGGLSTREHAESVRATLRFLAQQEGNFLLIGDTSILYALTGRPSVFLSLWFHPGLTIPPEGTEAFEQFERRQIENLERYGVRFVVLEGDRTWVKTQLSSFPRVDTYVRSHGVGTHRFGPFTIVEMSDARAGNEQGG